MNEAELYRWIGVAVMVSVVSWMVGQTCGVP